MTERERPYNGIPCITLLLRDALAMLKELESVEPDIADDGLPDEGGAMWYECGNCGKAIDTKDAFCRHCGRKVKWDET